MRIVRRQPRYGYVQVLNAIARDYRLSWRARGLLVELLSYPPGYEITIDELVARGREHGRATEGRDAMRKAGQELKALGYIIATKRQDESGRWHTDLEVTDDPMYDLLDGVSAGHADDWKPVSRSDQAKCEFPQVTPTTGNPTVGFSGVNKKTEKNTKNTSSPSPSIARQSQQPHQEEEISAKGKTNPVSEHRADDAEHHDGEHQAAAVELVVSLPGTPTGGNRARLVALVITAMSAGWTAQQLRAELTRDLGTAASRVAVWVSRLRDIGEPPAIAPAEISAPTKAPLPECDECGRPLPGGGLCRDCRQVESEVTEVPGSRAAVEALRAQMGWMAAAS